MGTITFNGKEIPFDDGDNIIEAAKKAGTEIPHYCYHPGLTVVAQCRMCLVEIEGARKLATACSTPCSDGMVVSSESPTVKEAVAGVQEFLLLNHPLDCPICDQAGECSLQEYSLEHGASDCRTDLNRRTYIDVDMGPSIKKNMNRCIHCTRCIRYCDEIGDIYEMVSLQRGNNTEIVTIDDKPLMTAYAGGLADVCPVGSLTTKDFRFSKRVWYLRESDSICDGCSKGCNTVVSHEKNLVYRFEPRENQEINKWWMCDEGRYGFHFMQSPSRIHGPAVKGADSMTSTQWSEAGAKFKELLSSAKTIAVVASADITNEEADILKTNLGSKAELFSYSPTVDSSSEDEATDHLLRRKDKSPNLRGLEDKGYAAFSKFDPTKFDLVVYASGGKVRPPYGIAELSKSAVGIGVFLKEEVAGYDLILPGPSWLEKEGSYTNYEGKSQCFGQAIRPLGLAKPMALVFSKYLADSVRQVG